MITTNFLLNAIGWAFLIISWIVPATMKKDNADRFFIGAVLAAVSVGFFGSSLIVQLMK